MKTLRAQKRMAAKALKVGENKVYFDPERLSDIREAVTKQDMLDLIKSKAVKKKPVVGQKKRAHKKKLKRKKKGRRRGTGRKKKVLNKRKQTYVKKIRKIRNYLENSKSKISREEYLQLKRLIRGGQISELKELKVKILK